MKAIHLTSQQQLNEFMVRIEQAGEGFRLPLLRAAADGSLTVVAVAGGQAAPEHHLKETKPTVVIISDDHPSATGPRRWKQLPRLLHWANAVILHATGGQPQHYELIATTTVIMTRVLVVEMQQKHHAAWLQRVQGRGAHVINIVPPPGDTHPRTAAPAGTVIQ